MRTRKARPRPRGGITHPTGDSPGACDGLVPIIKDVPPGSARDDSPPWIGNGARGALRMFWLVRRNDGQLASEGAASHYRLGVRRMLRVAASRTRWSTTKGTACCALQRAEPYSRTPTSVVRRKFGQRNAVGAEA